MFDRFTDEAQRTITLANEESRALGHNYIGTEHLLLGLLRAGGLAESALRSAGVMLEPARGSVVEIIGYGNAPPTGHIPFTPRSKKVMELSLREALRLKHNYIGTEHLLLGLIREGLGVACQIMVKLGVDIPTLQEAVENLATDPELAASSKTRTREAQANGAPGPACPTCQFPLDGNLVYKVLEMREAGGEEDRYVMFGYCRRCGGIVDDWLIPKEKS